MGSTSVTNKGSVKHFCLGDVLSVTTGLNVSPDGFSGTTNLISHLVDAGEHGPMRYGLMTAAGNCRALLLEQFPQLAEIRTPEVLGADDVDRWLSDQQTSYGNTFAVWSGAALAELRAKTLTVDASTTDSRSDSLGIA